MKSARTHTLPVHHKMTKPCGARRKSSGAPNSCFGLVCMMYSRGRLLSELLGHEISPEQTNIVGRVFIKANVACTNPVETAYYSSRVFDDVCINCGDPNDIV